MAQPDLLLATTPVSHPDDAWQGVLNLPTDFRVLAANETRAEASAQAKAWAYENDARIGVGRT